MFNVESIDATYFREKKYFCCVLLVICVCVRARARFCFCFNEEENLKY